MSEVRGKAQTAVKMELGRGVEQTCCCAHGELDLKSPETSFRPGFLLTAQGLKQNNKPGTVSVHSCKAKVLTLLVPRAVDTADIQELGAGWVQVILGVFWCAPTALLPTSQGQTGSPHAGPRHSCSRRRSCARLILRDV